MRDGQEYVFPIPSPQNSYGLTIREVFAGMAMAALLNQCKEMQFVSQTVETVGRVAVQAADALIAALNETEDERWARA